MMEEISHENNETFFYQNDFDEFRQWVDINIEDLTWQGKFEEDFHDFWKIFFVDGLSLEQIMERFEYAKTHVKIGPLFSWFDWLKNKFICFTFMRKDLNIHELSLQTNIDCSHMAFILRDFFIGHFPHQEELLSEKFHLGNVASENLHLSYKDLSSYLNFPDDFLGSREEEVMRSLEITLYEEWEKFLKEIRNNLLHTAFDIEKLKERASFTRQKKFFRDLVVLFAAGAFVIWGVKIGNKWYEDSLSEQISIFKLDFSWLNQSVPIKVEKKEVDQAVTVNFKELEELEKAEKKKDSLEFSEQERYIPESEVVLTSVDSLPKDFDLAGLKRSEYEEVRKGGYRDTRAGNNKKVFRVLMKSVDIKSAREKLNKIVKKYDAEPLGNVKPGTFVPGGVYYNLHVPRNYLREFLTSAMEVDEAILYENRGRGRNPPGKNKVFLWIKQI